MVVGGEYDGHAFIDYASGSRITLSKSRESSEVHLSRILGDPEILGGDEESGMFHYA
jgi:hypothetical protein